MENTGHIQLNMKRINNVARKWLIFALLTEVIHCGKDHRTLLTGPRLHFSGNFICDPATVNNNIKNFDITSFMPHHALPSSEGGKGLYSPRGTNTILLSNARIGSVCYRNQVCTDDKEIDNIIGMEIKDNPKSTAKIVDIDPQDPVGVTQIWAMKIRIPGVMAADADVLSMRNMWRREVSKTTDIDSVLTGQFHGILKNVAFQQGAIESKFVEQLRSNVENSTAKELSIRFVLDSYRFNHTGRIYGTIGCHGYDAPQSTLLSRVLVPLDRGSYSKALFAVDEGNTAIVFDFGSSFRTTENGSHAVNESEYFLITYKHQNGRETQGEFVIQNWKQSNKILGVIPLWREDWLTKGAGFITLMISEKTLEEVKKSPLEVIKVKGEGVNAISQGVVLQEPEDGVQIFPMGDPVLRMESGDTLDIEFLATKFGLPHSGIVVSLVHHCEADHKDFFCEPKLPLPLALKTDRNGLAKASLKLPDLTSPRKVTDGQVYKIGYFSMARELSQKLHKEFELRQHPSIVLKIFDKIEYTSNVTWVDHVYPIFLQYANLFPVMKSKTFDISNYYSVVQMKNMITSSLNLPMNHSNYMPVTRDLSQRKRRMIVDWLSNDKPRLGKVEKLMNIQHLRSLLQTALEVEHATIPPYLIALWSIRNEYNKQIQRIIKTIVKQEMLHMGLVANVINAVGGHPSFIHSTFILNYPSKLPGGLRSDLIVSLERLSRGVSRDVFMKIEEPDYNVVNQKLRKTIFEHMELLRCEKKLKKESTSKECKKYINMTSSAANSTKRGCPQFVKDYLEMLSEEKPRHLDLDVAEDFELTKEHFDYKKTIAAFYTRVLVVIARLTNCGADDSIFSGKRELQLTTDNYNYGNGKLIAVSDYISAVTALKMVIEEGEGTSDCDPAVHYFDQSDDMSHYNMFETIIKGHRIRKQSDNNRRLETNYTNHKCEATYEYSGQVVHFHPEGLWPIKKNARQSDYNEGTLVAIRSKVFNVMYNRMLAALHATFNGQKEYFKNSLFLMHAVDYYGRQLVKYSIDPHGSPYVGPNAAPVFKWVALGLEGLNKKFGGESNAHENKKKNKAGKEKGNKIKKRKGSRVKMKRGRKGHRRGHNYRTVNAHVKSKWTLGSRMRNRGRRTSTQHRILPEESLVYERENELRTNPDDYEREREDNYRRSEYRNDLLNYEDRLKQSMKFYEDIKDEMNMARVIEEMWRIKKMEDAEYENDDNNDDNQDSNDYNDNNNDRDIDYYIY